MVWNLFGNDILGNRLTRLSGRRQQNPVSGCTSNEFENDSSKLLQIPQTRLVPGRRMVLPAWKLESKYCGLRRSDCQYHSDDVEVKRREGS